MLYLNKSRKPLIILITVLSLSVLNTGCATSEKSILTGAAIGGATGAAIGSQRDSKGAAIGAASGLLLGGLIGYLGFKDKKKKSKTKRKAKVKDDFPFITKPVVRKYSPAPKVEGNKYIRNCEIFEIKENSKWRK